MNRLPDYLRMRVNAAPNEKNVVTVGDVRITVITPRLIRIEQGAFTDEATQVAICRNFDPTGCTLQAAGGQVHIHTGYLTLDYQAGSPLETLTIASLQQPAFTWHYGQKPLHNLKGTTSTLDCVNGACPLEDGLCALDGFALLDDSKSLLITKDGWFAPRKPCTDVYFFGYGHDYTACVQDYQRLTGGPGMLPAFALGNWWSRYHAYTDEEYLGLMDRFQQQDVPLAVGIVDMDWHLVQVGDKEHGNGWTGYTWNEKLFPDYKAFIKGLHERGLRTALNLHPAQGVRYWETQYEDFCRAMGKDPADKKPIPFNGLDPDFLRAYFELLHFPYEEDGVDFWWMDWQQGADWAAITGQADRDDSLDGVTPLWLVNHMHHLAAQRGGKRPLLFSRFAGYGSQRYPIGFSGDSMTTWQSLQFQPYFTVTASNVGYGWWSHDIGGHMGGVRDDELTTRWVQFGVFSPIFRLHSNNSPFTGREPWKYNKRAELVISDFMRLRHRLFPYLYTMNRRASEELIPLMRPMYHVSPECAEAYQAPNEYWFGSEMIAAPITVPADCSDLASVKVWLPEGLWTDAMTGYIYRGGRCVTFYRPLEEMPLMLRAGAIVPMQPHVPGSRQLGASSAMEALIAPGASNTFALYEDDGETRRYQEGEYAVTRLSLDWQETQAVFAVHPAEGSFPLPRRRWTLNFRGWRKGCTFTVNGAPLAAAYVPETNTYTVVLPEIAPEEGVEVRIVNEGGLLHDDSDCRDRILERLTRAQIIQDDKFFLLKQADLSLQNIRDGIPINPAWFGGDRHPSLAGYAYELALQLT